MKKRFILRPLLIFVIVLSFGQHLFAYSYDHNRWYNEFSLYSWLPGQTGTIAINGNEYAADIVFDQLIRKVNWSLNLGYEGRYDLWMVKWTGAFVRSFDLSDERDVETSLSLTDATIGFMPWWERFYIIAGGRYFNVNAEVINKNLDEIEKIKKSKSWFDLFAGVRYELPITDRFSVFLRGDVGGLGSQFSWNTSAMVRWTISNFALDAGYRTWGVNYKSGQGDNLFKWHVVTTGPGLGMSFFF